MSSSTWKSENLIPKINATHLTARANSKKFTLSEKVNEGWTAPDAQTALIGVFHKYNKPLSRTLQSIVDNDSKLKPAGKSSGESGLWQ